MFFRYASAMIGWLVACGVGTWVGARVALGYPAPGKPYRVLRRAEVATISAVADAMFPPGGHIPSAGADADLPGYIDRWMSVSATRTRVLMHLLFFLIEHATVIFPAPGAGGRRRYSSLGFDQRVAVLDGWGESGLYLRRLVFMSLRSILTMGYFAHPPVLRQLGVAPLAITSPIVEADLLYPAIGKSRASIALTRDDLTAAVERAPLLPGSPLHPDFAEESS
jgi:hypothetical protein